MESNGTFNEQRIVRPDEIEWKPQPALPGGAQISMIHGNPEKEESYLFRLRVPPKISVMPHSHPEERIYTVISGVFFVGFGDKFNQDQLQRLLPGSLVFIPANAMHFQYSDTESYEVQVEGIGPTAFTYCDLREDPRLKQ